MLAPAHIRIISIATIAVAFIVLLSWIFNIPLLNFPLSGTISMKFNTSLSFLFAGFLLYSSTFPVDGRHTTQKAFALLCGVIILLIMVPSFLGIIYNRPMDWSNLILKDTRAIPLGQIPGSPSIGTAVAFIFLGIAGLAMLFSNATMRTAFHFVGSIVACLGSVSILGYLINAPILYFYVPTVTNGMAISTSVLFVLLGKGFFDAGKFFQVQSSAA